MGGRTPLFSLCGGFTPQNNKDLHNILKNHPEHQRVEIPKWVPSLQATLIVTRDALQPTPDSDPIRARAPVHRSLQWTHILAPEGAYRFRSLSLLSMKS